MSKVFSFANLVAPTCTVFPSLGETVKEGIKSTEAHAVHVRGISKTQRRDWFKVATSNWPCISLVEGVNPKLRVTKENPPLFIHGFLADYDSIGKQFTPAELVDTVSRCVYPPAAGGPSLSGNGYHALWLFEEPVPVLGDYHYATKVLQVCFNKLRVANFVQGFDEAYKKPDRLLSIDPHAFAWFTDKEEAQLVDRVSTRMWASEVTKDFQFEGQELDLDKIYEHVQRLYPGRWQGTFSVGSRGCRFWDIGADDNTAAVVTATGMVYFSDGGGFKPWHSILGNDVVSKISADSLREITANWYYDATNQDYVHHDKVGETYTVKNRTQFFDRMELGGLDDTIDMKRAIVYVEDHSRVEAVVRLANQKKGIIQQGGLTYLNATSTKHIVPAKGVWDFTQALCWAALKEEEQYHIWMAYLQDLNRAARAGISSYAQALFIAGEPQCGKSLFQYHYLTPMLGGKSADPMPYLLGSTGFNGELADAGHWLVSDQEGAKSAGQRGGFTQKLKAAAANPAMSVNAKYCQPVTLYLNSRITFSFNKTDECLSVLPRLGMEVLDKVILLSFYSHSLFDNLHKEQIEALVREELPHFIYYLLEEYEAPKEVLNSGGRYRVKSFHHPDLLKHAKASQDNAELISYLHVCFEQSQMLKEEYVEKGKPAEFSAAHWLMLLNQNLGFHIGLTPNKLAAHFQSLAKQYQDCIKSRYEESKRVYVFSIDYNKFRQVKS